MEKHHKEEFRGDCSPERASRKSKTSRSQQNQVVQIAKGSASNAGKELFLNNSDGRESITTLAVTLSPSNCARQIRSYSTESLGAIAIHKTRYAAYQWLTEAAAVWLTGSWSRQMAPVGITDPFGLPRPRLSEGQNT